MKRAPCPDLRARAVKWSAALLLVTGAVAQVTPGVSRPYSELPVIAKLAVPAQPQAAKPRHAASALIAQTGAIAAVFFDDGKLRIWNLRSGELLRTIDVPGEAHDVVTGITEDGHYVLTATWDGHTVIWDTGSGKAAFDVKLAHYAGVAAFSHDSKLLAINAQGAPVQVFDIAANRRLFELPAGLGATAVAFSRDGRMIAAADGDTRVKVYDAHSGKLLATNQDLTLEPLAVDFSADSKQVIAGGAERALIFLDSASGKLLRRSDKVADPVGALQVSPDGTLLASVHFIADNMALPNPIAVWDVASGIKKREVVPPKALLGGAWLANGHCVIASESAPDVIEIRTLY